MSERIGQTRIRLAQIICDCLGWACEPEDLRPAGGRQRNRTTVFDGYAWEVSCETDTGVPVVAGSFDTMTECVRAGAVDYREGEISASYNKDPADD